MFFWGMLTGCGVVILGSFVASLFMKRKSKKKGTKNNESDSKDEKTERDN